METARTETDDVPGCRLYVPPPPRYQGEPAAAPGRFDSSVAVREYRQAARRIWPSVKAAPEPEPEPEPPTRPGLLEPCGVPGCCQPHGGRRAASGRPFRERIEVAGVKFWACSRCSSRIRHRVRKGIDPFAPITPGRGKPLFGPPMEGGEA